MKILEGKMCLHEVCSYPLSNSADEYFACVQLRNYHSTGSKVKSIDLRNKIVQWLKLLNL